jgi:hypothetical protein
MERNISEISQVIKIKDRYFCGFGKKNRVNTAWCLSGAATYQDHDVTVIYEKLVKLGKKPVIVKIGEMVQMESPS